MVPHRIVVIGASSGGVSALRNLFSQLSSDVQAAFFVVLHILPESPSVLATLLDRAGPLPAKAAEDNEPILPGHVYVAPPDFHLIVKQGYLQLHRGPRENRHRPAINPLFRSAAIAFPEQTIGVILTGYQDDGAAGLSAIKRCGGIAIVQDPHDASIPDMPTNALAKVDVDYRLPLRHIGKKVMDLVGHSTGGTHKVPTHKVSKDTAIEAKISEQTASVGSSRRQKYLDQPGQTSYLESNGQLLATETKTADCHRIGAGHSFIAKMLIENQDPALENALWAAMRTMEEHANLSLVMARNEAKRSREHSAQRYEDQSETLKAHAQVIRKLLIEGERFDYVSYDQNFGKQD